MTQTKKYAIRCSSEEEVLNQKELNQRDNDLADIFNTSPETETKWDLYMRIIEYLVKKWFLQNKYWNVLPSKDFSKSENVIEEIMEEINNFVWNTDICYVWWECKWWKNIRKILTKHLSSK